MGANSNPMGRRRRAMLAIKGRRLYGKYCGLFGRGICAESFAVYHIGLGESEVARDLVVFLERRSAELEADDPHGRLAMTQGLAARIRRHLEVAANPESEEFQRMPRVGDPLRRYVTNGMDSDGSCSLKSE